MSDNDEAIAKQKAEKRRVERARVWLHAWTAVASANDCKAKTTPTEWADSCLADFDKRFGA